LGVERQLGKSLSVGADFIYIHTVHLERNRDLNLPLPILRPTTVDPAQRPFYGLRTTPETGVCKTTATGGTAPVGSCVRPISTLGSITVRESTAKSLYRAFTLRAKFQKKWGQFNAFYTLSKNLTDDDNERDATGFRYENAFDTRPEYADSNIDRRHQFVTSSVFFLPHGIDVANSFRAFSGSPVDAGSGLTDPNEDRGGPDRPYLGPGVPFRRNGFRNLAVYFVDVHGAKRFTFAENKRLVFTVDIFNLFNTQNIQLSGSAVTNLCSPTSASCGFAGVTNPNFLQVIDRNPASTRFGKYLLNNNPGPPFQMQFGARFQF